MKMRVFGLVREGEWAMVAYSKKGGRWHLWGAQGAEPEGGFLDALRKMKGYWAQEGFNVVWEDRINPDESKADDDYLEQLGFERLGKGEINDASAISAVVAKRKRARKLLNRS